MAGTQKIIVGFDFTEGCVAALKRGRTLANLWKADLEVVHVLPELPYSGATQNKDLVDWMGQLEGEISEELSRQVQEVFSENSSVSTQILTGVPYKRLMEYSMEAKASLLILGHGSRSPLEELLLGRTLEGVLQNSLLPVWVEKGEGKEPIQEILLPTDLSEHSRPAVLLGLQWAKQMDATAHIFHAVEIPFVPRFSLLESEKIGETLGKVAQDQLNAFVETLPQEGVELKSY
ncbi:MAG: universal stress protein, partial [bacterium]|nr:universal stress protein [bacterium]